MRVPGFNKPPKAPPAPRPNISAPMDGRSIGTPGSATRATPPNPMPAAPNQVQTARLTNQNRSGQFHLPTQSGAYDLQAPLQTHPMPSSSTSQPPLQSGPHNLPPGARPPVNPGTHSAAQGPQLPVQRQAPQSFADMGMVRSPQGGYVFPEGSPAPRPRPEGTLIEHPSQPEVHHHPGMFATDRPQPQRQIPRPPGLPPGAAPPDPQARPQAETFGEMGLVRNRSGNLEFSGGPVVPRPESSVTKPPTPPAEYRNPGMFSPD